jgi:hypothetical protein
MEYIPLILALVFLAAAAFVGSSILKSPFWKRRQLRKASMMAARGRILEMTEYLRPTWIPAGSPAL